MEIEIENKLSTIQRRENIRYHNSRHFKRCHNLFEDKHELEHYIEGLVSVNHHIVATSGVANNKEVSFNPKCSVILVPDNIQLREENLRGTIWYTRKELDNMLYTTTLEVSNLMLKRHLSYCDALRQICEI